MRSGHHITFFGSFHFPVFGNRKSKYCGIDKGFSFIIKLFTKFIIDKVFFRFNHVVFAERKTFPTEKETENTLFPRLRTTQDTKIDQWDTISNLEKSNVNYGCLSTSKHSLSSVRRQNLCFHISYLLSDKYSLLVRDIALRFVWCWFPVFSESKMSIVCRPTGFPSGLQMEDFIFSMVTSANIGVTHIFHYSIDKLIKGTEIVVEQDEKVYLNMKRQSPCPIHKTRPLYGKVLLSASWCEKAYTYTCLLRKNRWRKIHLFKLH